MVNDPVTPISYVRLLYQKIDNEMARKDNCCQKGCAHCCYQLVEVLHIEEPLIIDYIHNRMTEQNKVQVKKNLAEWLIFFEAETPCSDVLTHDDVFVTFKERQVEESFPCPFLIHSECSIYEVRPISCRVHIELDFPELCIANRLRNTTFEAERIWSAFIAALNRHFPLYILPLPYLAANVLLPHTELKTIKFEMVNDIEA